MLIFFTHLIPAVLTACALLVIAAWPRSDWGRLRRLSAAIAPTAILVLLYASGFYESVGLHANIRAAFLSFPQKTFMYAGGGEQRMLWPVAPGLILAAMVCMRRTEWMSARGAVAAVTLLMFALYLLIPDLGFGGSVVKMRFAWAVFLFGGLRVYAVGRLQRFEVAISVLVAGLVVAQLTLITRQVRATSDAARLYLAAMEQLPVGARFVRAEYPAPITARHFETDRLVFDPLIHLAALAAVGRHAVDLSDYQSATGRFSVAFKPSIGEGYRGSPWSLESSEAGTFAGLDWVRRNIPISIDYLDLFGEGPPEEVTSRGTLMGTGGTDSFVRVYHSEITPAIAATILLPAAAQCAVQVHYCAEFIAAQAGQIELAGEEIAFRV